MPVNNLEKDTKSSDAMVRADAIRLLTDMTQNLKDIFPFLYEIIKAGAIDMNPYVQQVSLIALVKLYENTEIHTCFQDYEDDLRECIFNRILINDACCFESEESTLVFQTALEVLIALSSAQKEKGQKTLISTTTFE